MDEMKLGPVETRFAELIWANAPISSGELVKLCARELEWKKSTTYTVLKKLCDKGIFRNDGGSGVCSIYLCNGAWSGTSSAKCVVLRRCIRWFYSGCSGWNTWNSGICTDSAGR